MITLTTAGRRASKEACDERRGRQEGRYQAYGYCVAEANGRLYRAARDIPCHEGIEAQVRKYPEKRRIGHDKGIPSEISRLKVTGKADKERYAYRLVQEIAGYHGEAVFYHAFDAHIMILRV